MENKIFLGVAAFVIAVGLCSYSGGCAKVLVDHPCRPVAVRVGYPDAPVRNGQDGMCQILIGTDQDGNEVWASATR